MVGGGGGVLDLHVPAVADVGGIGMKPGLIGVCGGKEGLYGIRLVYVRLELVEGGIGCFPEAVV